MRSSTCSTAGRTESGHSTTSRAQRAPAGSAGHERGRLGWPTRRRAGSPGRRVDAQRVEGGGRRVEGVDGERVGGEPSAAAIASSKPGSTVQGGDGAEDVVGVVGGGEQGTGAVLAARLSSRASMRAAAVVRAVAAARGLGRAPRPPRGVGGGLVVGVETLLALFDPGDLGLEGAKSRSASAARPRPATVTQPAELVLGGLDARGPGPDLSGEVGQALAPVGRAARRGPGPSPRRGCARRPPGRPRRRARRGGVDLRGEGRSWSRTSALRLSCCGSRDWPAARPSSSSSRRPLGRERRVGGAARRASDRT